MKEVLEKRSFFPVLIRQKIFFIIARISFLEKLYLARMHGFKPLSHCAPSMLEKVFQKANKLRILNCGDYYEFGIYNGCSLLYSQQNATKYKASKMRFFGFDSFEGLPAIQKEDKGGYFYKGKYAYSKSDVINNLKSYGGDMTSVRLVKGFFNKSLKKSLIKKYKMKKIAIAYIDCDLYSSTKEVLNFIRYLLTKDSLIIFDDWNSSLGRNSNRGQQLAFKEFCRDNPQIKFMSIFSYCWHGQVFCVSKMIK